jgi:hypothetical protein
MEMTILTFMIVSLLVVFAVDTAQKRRNDLNNGKQE